MNAKLLIPAAIIGIFLFSSKSKASSKSAPKVDEEVDTDTEEKEETNKEEDKPPVDTYPLITASRKQVINELIKLTPTVTAEPFPYGSYKDWAKPRNPAYYQEWLTNQAYWKIAKNEKKTDVFNQAEQQTPPGYTNEFPFFLKKGVRGYYKDRDNLPAGFEVVNFTESDEDAKKRISKGVALWGQIHKYIMNTLDKCPPGTQCDPN